MGFGQVSIKQLEVSDCKPAGDPTSWAKGRARADKDFDWQVVYFLAITLALVAYGCYLAWESGEKLLWLVASPAAEGPAVVGGAVQVVAPLLPPLSYLVVYLSRRRDVEWFFRDRALCLLGLLTGVIEALVRGLG